MKGPSLDAIRRFKQEQELKKREEEEERLKAKLSTLKHRANQGDRKAKQELKKLEQIEEERNKRPPDYGQQQQKNVNKATSSSGHQQSNDQKQKSLANKKPVKKVEMDFDELMSIAKKNINEIKKPAESQKSEEKTQKINKIKKKVVVDAIDWDEVDRRNKSSEKVKSLKIVDVKGPTNKQTLSKAKVPIDPKKALQDERIQAAKRREAAMAAAAARRAASSNASINEAPTRGKFQMQYNRPSVSSSSSHIHHNRPPMQVHQLDYRDRVRNRYDDYDEEEEEDEDDYQADGFVVDDDEDDAQDALRETLRTVFRYDRRRCDLREEELDRQYRAIGSVNNFEDLEREERRASRLAAAEDAKAQRDEDERKRLKKIRLKGA